MSTTIQQAHERQLEQIYELLNLKAPEKADQKAKKLETGEIVNEENFLPPWVFSYATIGGAVYGIYLIYSFIVMSASGDLGMSAGEIFSLFWEITLQYLQFMATITVVQLWLVGYDWAKEIVVFFWDMIVALATAGWTHISDMPKFLYNVSVGAPTGVYWWLEKFFVAVWERLRMTGYAFYAMPQFIIDASNQVSAFLNQDTGPNTFEFIFNTLGGTWDLSVFYVTYSYNYTITTIKEVAIFTYTALIYGPKGIWDFTVMVFKDIAEELFDEENWEALWDGIKAIFEFTFVELPKFLWNLLVDFITGIPDFFSTIGQGINDGIVFFFSNFGLDLSQWDVSITNWIIIIIVIILLVVIILFAAGVFKPKGAKAASPATFQEIGQIRKLRI